MRKRRATGSRAVTARPVAILGSGGHARVVADACRAAGRHVAGFLDPGAVRESTRSGVVVLGGDDLLESAEFVARHEFLVAIGSQALRRSLCARVRERGGTLTRVAHPSAVVAPDVRLGAGSVLAAGSVVNTGTVVGEFVIVNTGATVDHDNLLGDGTQLGPGAHLAGEVHCGEDALLGPGAIVVRGCRIGTRAIVGAGAVVLSDVPPDVTVVGLPARILERRA